VPLVWLVVGVGLAVAELFSMTFVLVMFSVGAFAAATVAVLGFGLVWQALIFMIVSTCALVLVRPAAQRRLLGYEPPPPMGLSAIEGAMAVVLEEVDVDHGLVKIEGEMWRARTYAADQVIPAGSRVRIVEVRGATAMVWRD
jgi:membrane protein implicated in regulation of membrane protease activity